MKSYDHFPEDYRIRREEPKDELETEMLVREAFWNVYHPGCTEHYILHCFRTRKEFIPQLDLVMEKDSRIIGQIMYVHSQVDREDGSVLQTVTFGPACIHPYFQHMGYGRKLVNASLDIAARLGAGAVIITGNLLFYGKSGFVPAKAKGIHYWEDPESDYLLVRELREGYLAGIQGTFVDPEGYLAAVQQQEAFEAYDRKFPQKEKKVLPGQLDFDPPLPQKQ